MRTSGRLALSNNLSVDLAFTQFRRVTTCRMRLVSNDGRHQVVTPSAMFTTRRWISAAGTTGAGNNNSPQQQPMPPPQQPMMYGQSFYGSAPPPPPPPYYYSAPPPPPHYAAGMPPPSPPPSYATSAAAAAPPQMAAGELGSKERPLVVVSPPQPKTLASRLWTLLILVIGISAIMNLIDAFEVRTGGTPAVGGGAGGLGGGSGGNSRIASLFGVQEVKPTNLDSMTVTFSDIQGCDEAKEELEDLVEFLRDPKKFQELGARLPKGCLLVGGPGTGKTMLAKAIAKEAGVAFFYATGSEFDEMFVGVGSRRIRELFAAAKQHSPALIFIDEVDALGGKRTGKDHSHNRMTLNQLLAEMDGFQANDAVVVIAATNTPDSLDKALTRPGRFDTTVAVDPPDLKGREAIVQTYLNKIKKDNTVQALDIAKGTSGMTGAELANLVNVAAIRATVLGKKEVSSAEVDYAKDRVLMGAECRSKIIPEEEKKITAHHEGGHALVALLLANDGAEPVHKATIVPRGSGIMGLVQQQPEKDRYSQSRKQMLARLQVCLAGRIAEEMLLGNDDVTSGASSDFQQATNIARNMVRRFGFGGELGTIDYESAETSEGAWLSDVTKAKIEEEVRHIVHDSYVDARKLLEEHKPQLQLIADNLLKHETLSGEQLKAIVDGKPMPPSKLSTEVRKKRPSATTPPSPPKGGTPVEITVTPKKSGDGDSGDASKQ